MDFQIKKVNSRDELTDLKNDGAILFIGLTDECVSTVINDWLPKEEDPNLPDSGGYKDDITSVDVYNVTGEELNKWFALGSDSFQKDLSIMVIELKVFKSLEKLAAFRIAMGPDRLKWLDDFYVNQLKVRI